MNQTVCDFCRDDEPLYPKTGRYVLIIRKVLSDDGGSQSYENREFDLCGACAADVRKVGKKVKW